MAASYPREDFSLIFTGAAIQEHSMDIVSLAKNLEAFQKVVDRADKAINNRKHSIVVKLTSNIKEGSIVFDMFSEYIGKLCPIFPDVIYIIKSYIEIFIKAKENNIDIEEYINKENQQQGGEMSGNHIDFSGSNISNSFIILEQDKGFKDAVRNFVGSIGKDTECGIGMNKNGKFDITYIKEEAKKYFFDELQQKKNDTEEIEQNYILEIINSNNIGKSDGWTFRNTNTNSQFSAIVTDIEFLSSIFYKKINFQNGDCINAIVKTVKQNNKQIDYITNVLEFIRPTEQPEIGMLPM